MLIRTNSILKLDLPFTETSTRKNTNNRANIMNTSIITTIVTMVNDYDLIQEYINNNIKAKKRIDSEQARVLAPDKQGSSFICRTDQDEDGQEEEEDETHAQTTTTATTALFPYSSSSSSESISSKTTITNCLGIHQYASTNCNDAAFALIEQRIVLYQSNDVNEEREVEEHLDRDWTIHDAADNDAADHVDQGSFVSSINSNQQQQDTNDEDEDNDTDTVHLSKERQEEEWFKGTLFYDNPGTPPMLPPKDYISLKNHIIDFDEHKKIYNQDVQSMYQQPTASPSLYSLAISTNKIGTSIKSHRRTITGKFRNALKRKSIFSRA